MRLRWAVRFAFIIGIAASVAANALHAQPNPISRTIAGWPPVALFIAVEFMLRIPIARKRNAVIRMMATVALAVIAAWISYWHMAAVALKYGETGSSAYLLPFTVDGLLVVSAVSLVALTAAPAAVAVQQLAHATPIDEAPPVAVVDQLDPAPLVDDQPAPPRQVNGKWRPEDLRAFVLAHAHATPQQRRSVAEAAGVSERRIRQVLNAPAMGVAR